ncbi:ROK family protein [Colwellia asteriadis]|uniref:ROK family protein n=2 Tax=Colwelliaceae TaxID=267889 RepID=A0ABN1L735_9GAMM
MVEELLDIGLVIEVGIKKEGAVGKPSKMLDLNPEGCYSFSIRMFLQKIELGIFSLTGLAIVKMEAEYNQGNELSVISESFNTLMAQAKLKKSQILGAGITFVSNKEHNLLTYQKSMDFKVALTETLALPIATENTASACAAYQMLYGEAKHLHSFVCVHISDVVEAAVVYDRSILLGANGLTGAIGEMFVTPETDEKTVELGRLNDFASLNSLQAHFAKSFTSQEALMEYCYNNPKVFEQWLEKSAEPMRIAIHSLETLLNCQTIIIGGDVDSWFLDKFITQLRPYIPSIAQYGDRSVVRLIKVPKVEELTLKATATLPLHAALSMGNMQTLSLPPFNSLEPVQQLIYLAE